LAGQVIALRQRPGEAEPGRVDPPRYGLVAQIRLGVPVLPTYRDGLHDNAGVVAARGEAAKLQRCATRRGDPPD